MTTTIPHSKKDVILFHIGPETFALMIDHVVEIIRPVKVNKLPLVPLSIEGLINVRDMVYPLIDLKKLFNIDKTVEYTDDEQFILVKCLDITFALHVDHVEAISSFTSTQLLTDENLNQFTEGILPVFDDKAAHLLALEPMIQALKEEALMLVTS